MPTAMQEQAAPSTFALDVASQVHPQVALRPEAFGALAYHFGTRRLSFLKSPALRDLVTSLEEHATARDACVTAGVGANGLPAYVETLSMLAATDMIIERCSS